MQPYFFTPLPGLWLGLKYHFVINYQIYSKTIYFKVYVTKKQIWLEMDSDIILNKPDLNT